MSLFPPSHHRIAYSLPSRLLWSAHSPPQILESAHHDSPIHNNQERIRRMSVLPILICTDTSCCYFRAYRSLRTHKLAHTDLHHQPYITSDCEAGLRRTIGDFDKTSCSGRSIPQLIPIGYSSPDGLTSSYGRIPPIRQISRSPIPFYHYLQIMIRLLAKYCRKRRRGDGE